MNCPKCSKRLQYLGGNGLTHVLQCLDHGYSCLSVDGLVHESDVVQKATPMKDMDITADIKKELPKQLLEKLSEAEKVLKKEVTIYESGELYGGSQGMMDPQGKIWIASASRKDMGVVGEEIMHLHWRTSGLPRMKPLEPAKQGGYESPILQLGGHFEEYSFFPFLQDLALNPRGVIDRLIPSMAADLAAGVDRVKAEPDSVPLRILLAAKYVQAKVMTSGSNGGPALKIFEHVTLKPYAKVFDLVCEEVMAAKDKSKDEVKERMERTLYTHLDLPKDSVSVEPITY